MCCRCAKPFRHFSILDWPWLANFLRALQQAMPVLRRTPLWFRDVFVLLQLRGELRRLCSVFQASIWEALGPVRQDMAFDEQWWPTSHPTGPQGLRPGLRLHSPAGGAAGTAVALHVTSHPTGPLGLPPTLPQPRAVPQGSPPPSTEAQGLQPTGASSSPTCDPTLWTPAPYFDGAAELFLRTQSRPSPSALPWFSPCA